MMERIGEVKVVKKRMIAKTTMSLRKIERIAMNTSGSIILPE